MFSACPMLCWLFLSGWSLCLCTVFLTPKGWLWCKQCLPWLSLYLDLLKFWLLCCFPYWYEYKELQASSLNCFSSKFPLVLIMHLGMACSGTNKVNPLKPTCQALHPHSLSLPLSTISIPLHRSQEQYRRQFLLVWHLLPLSVMLLCVGRGHSLHFLPLWNFLPPYEQATVGIIRAPVFSACHAWSKTSSLWLGTRRGK